MRDLLANSLIVLFALNGSPLNSVAQQAAAPVAAPVTEPTPIAAAPVAAPAVAAAPASNPDASGKYTLRDGDDVNLAFVDDLSSKTSSEGDPVAFTLVDDLKVGNVVVAKAGSKAIG